MSDEPVDPDKERHTFVMPPGESWVETDGEPAPDGTWAEMTLDLGDPHTQLTTPESFVEEPPPPRRAQVIDGGFDEVLAMLWAADRFRARLMRRDLRWLNQIVTAAGMKIVLVRDARGDD